MSIAIFATLSLRLVFLVVVCLKLWQFDVDTARICFLSTCVAFFCLHLINFISLATLSFLLILITFSKIWLHQIPIILSTSLELLLTILECHLEELLMNSLGHQPLTDLRRRDRECLLHTTASSRTRSNASSLWIPIYPTEKPSVPLLRIGPTFHTFTLVLCPTRQWRRQISASRKEILRMFWWKTMDSMPQPMLVSPTSNSLVGLLYGYLFLSLNYHKNSHPHYYSLFNPIGCIFSTTTTIFMCWYINIS